LKPPSKPPEMTARPFVSEIPRHVAIMMDGNRTWARFRNLPIMAGHVEGALVVDPIIEIAAQLGVQVLTFFAFSTENWSRSLEEVNHLFDLMTDQLKTHTLKAVEQGVALTFIGDHKLLPEHLQKQIQQTTIQTQYGSKIKVVFAINYGARSEITDVVKKIAVEAATGKIELSQIDESYISEKLETYPYGDPQLLIRTSGQYRLSNFLLWQLAYTELYFCEDPWPSFTPTHFLKAITTYQNRQRRFGA
jgi:undecaprenyl diphosphate synthase